MQQPNADTVSPARSLWPDIAKGFGIVLVVFGHTWRGLAEAGILVKSDLFYAIDTGIYAFHMPLFFFLSGWFFPKIVIRDSAMTLLRRVLWRLFYPMCLWTYIFISVKILAGGSANEPVGFDDLLRLPVPGYLHLWFLWALIVLTLAGIVLRPLLLRWLMPCLVGVIAVSLAMNYYGIFYDNEFFRAGVASSIYFFLGAALGAKRVLPKSGRAAAAALAVFIMADGLAIYLGGQYHVFIGMGIAISASLAVLSIIRYLDHRFSAHGIARRGLDIFSILGRLSLTIYMVHTIMSAMVRIVLLKFGVVSVPLHLVLGVSAGLLGPLLLHIPSIPVAWRAMASIPPFGRRSS